MCSARVEEEERWTASRGGQLLMADETPLYITDFEGPEFHTVHRQLLLANGRQKNRTLHSSLLSTRLRWVSSASASRGAQRAVPVLLIAVLVRTLMQFISNAHAIHK